MQIAAILDRGNFFRRNCRDLKMNRTIAAAAPIAASNRDMHANIRSLNLIPAKITFRPICETSYIKTRGLTVPHTNTKRDGMKTNKNYYPLLVYFFFD